MAKAKSPDIELFQFAAITLVKFGTIGFFLISGFLLEKNLRTRTSLQVMERRLTKVFLPWTFWFFLTCVVVAAFQCIRHTGAFLPGRPLHVALRMTVLHTFTTTSFWFVPNLTVASMVLLIFRKSLRSLWLGGTLLATTLFYSLNIYTQWIETHHARAIFGFIFYLWLGHYAAVEIDRFSKLLRSIPARTLRVATLFAALATFGEGRLLVHLHTVDPLNTLKVTTQIFSILVFLCFFKYERRIWPAFIDVPRNTFGMYLVHLITLETFMCPLRALLTRSGNHAFLDSFAMRVTIWVATVAMVAGTSLVLARFLSASPALSWAVGSPRRVASAKPVKAEAAGVAVLV